MEIWKLVPSYPQLEASSYGRIRLAIERVHQRWKVGVSSHRKGYVYLPSQKHGYLIIRISIKNKRRQLFVHFLVCEAFHGKRPTKKHRTAHDDGNKNNNQPRNLLWKTQIENIADRERHGTTSRGEKHSQAVKKGIKNARSNS